MVNDYLYPFSNCGCGGRYEPDEEEMDEIVREIEEEREPILIPIERPDEGEAIPVDLPRRVERRERVLVE